MLLILNIFHFPENYFLKYISYAIKNYYINIKDIVIYSYLKLYILYLLYYLSIFSNNLLAISEILLLQLKSDFPSGPIQYITFTSLIPYPL